MSKDLPKCDCGANSWDDRGGSFGSLSQRNFRCSACNRTSMHISSHGGNLFMIAVPSGGDISSVAIDWFNNIVLPAWRSNCTTGSPKYGERVPVPPRIPTGEVSVWLNRVSALEDTWEHIDPKVTQNMAIPADPVRAEHIELFESIFEAVGIPARFMVEIPNRYYKDAINSEPWYSISIGEVVFTVGPRKRVISIGLNRKDGEAFDTGSSPFDYNILTDVVSKDNTTYDADQFRIVVHAYGKHKAIQYLGILVNAAVPVLDRMAEIT